MQTQTNIKVGRGPQAWHMLFNISYACLRRIFSPRVEGRTTISTRESMMLHRSEYLDMNAERFDGSGLEFAVNILFSSQFRHEVFRFYNRLLYPFHSLCE